MHIQFFHKRFQKCKCLHHNVRVFLAILLIAFIYAESIAATNASAVNPPTIPLPGWKSDGQPYKYTSNNLYNYINGAADFFVSYGFVCLTGMNYVHASKDSSSITVDIYDMGEKLNAFGVFQSRRDNQSPSLKIGAASFGTGDYVVFHKNMYYVEIQAHLTDKKYNQEVPAFAGKVAEQLPGDASLPPELLYFPEKAKVAGSEQYIRGGILGHGFYERGLVCDYRFGDEEVSAFIVFLPSKEDAEKSFQQHRSFLKNSGKQCKPIAGKEKRGFSSEEPYHKKIIVIQEGTFVAGVYDLTNLKKGKKLLEGIIENLKQKGK